MNDSSVVDPSSKSAIDFMQDSDLAQCIVRASPDDELRMRLGTLWSVLQRLNMEWRYRSWVYPLAVAIVHWTKVRLHRNSHN